jgi:hypothetical protein
MFRGGMAGIIPGCDQRIVEGGHSSCGVVGLVLVPVSGN